MRRTSPQTILRRKTDENPVLIATALLVLCTGVYAQEQQKKEMPPDQKAAMDAMMKAMTPGDAHKLLDGMAGTWDAKVSMWMDPASRPRSAPASRRTAGSSTAAS